MIEPSPAHVLGPMLASAEREPDRVLLTLVDERGRDAEVRTAGQFVRAARSLAGYLQKGCGLRRGDVALLLYPPGMEFIEAFAACLLAGVIPAPAYPPNPARPHAALGGLRAIAAQSGARAILTSRAYRWAMRMSAVKDAITGEAARWPALPWYVTQGLGWLAAPAELPPERGPDDLAFLQFTSGSTSTPKGVRLTHANLIHQLDFNAETLGMGPDARFVCWVPQYHDLGLISGVLSVLRGNGRLWFMSPQSFLVDAAIWPATMDRVRGTHTASPNFGYELVTRRTTAAQRARWDLSCLRVMMSAAEPIVPRTMDSFFEAFAPSGLSPRVFCPAYGLAEHTVGVTVWGRERVQVDRQSLVRDGTALIDATGDLGLFGCGSASHGIEVRIVDAATRTALSDRRVGEIWVQSASVADGYQSLPEATHATFGATLEGAPGTWLRTGDLGFMHRGELYVTGRLKDLIIVRGRNLHPEDLEEAVRFCHPALRPGGVVAFAVPDGATEALVLVAEVKDPRTADVEGALRAIDQRIRETWQIPATIALASPGALKKTTSGKLQRNACRSAWLEGELPLLQGAERRPATASRVHSVDAPGSSGSSWRGQLADLSVDDRLPWLLDAAREIATAEIGPEGGAIGPDDFLPGLGLDSLTSAKVLALLDERLEHRFRASLFIEHPTLRGAAARMLQELGLEFTGAPAPIPVEEPMRFRPPPRAMPPATTRVGIVGGGVGGLVAALELARLGYSSVVVFEAAAQCGGKVLSAPAGDGVVELGQTWVADTYRVVLELATELGLELTPEEGGLRHWDEEHGFEDGPALAPGLKWMRSVLHAAHAETSAELPFPSMLDLDEPFGVFLARHNLRRVHPRFQGWWRGMGYGVEADIPASYVIAYLQLVARTMTFARLPAGNQSLWIRLAEHLEQAWGVTVRRHTAVTRVSGDATGVDLEVGGVTERFDEVILAVPPQASTRLLAETDPLRELMTELSHFGFALRSLQATGLSGTESTFVPDRGCEPGRTVVMRGSPELPGWYVAGQYTSAPGGAPVAHEALEAELAETVRAMGGEVTALGPERDWAMFPFAGKDPSVVLRRAESLQGTRHLWTTGSWISFETVEHVARHARHLVRTCFDPAAGGAEPGLSFPAARPAQAITRGN